MPKYMKTILQETRFKLLWWKKTVFYIKDLLSPLSLNQYRNNTIPTFKRNQFEVLSYKTKIKTRLIILLQTLNNFG